MKNIENKKYITIYKASLPNIKRNIIMTILILIILIIIILKIKSENVARTNERPAMRTCEHNEIENSSMKFILSLCQHRPT